MNRTPRALAPLLCLLVALGSLLGAAPAGAQATGPEIEVSGIDLSAFPTVRLTAALGAGVASPDLGADDFTVTENGEPVAAEVSPLSDESLGITLAVVALSAFALASSALAVTVPDVPVDAYGNTLLSGLASAIGDVLPYAAAREAADPDAALQQFLQSTFAAAAALLDWPKGLTLDGPPGLGRPPV